MYEGVPPVLLVGVSKYAVPATAVADSSVGTRVSAPELPKLMVEDVAVALP